MSTNSGPPCILPRPFILQLPTPICCVCNGSGSILRFVVRFPIFEARFNGVGGEVLWLGLVGTSHIAVRLDYLNLLAAVCKLRLSKIIYN